MKKHLLLLIPVFLAASISPAWASELFGKVTYKGQPLKNADVSVKDKKIKTNDLGSYSIQLDPGGYVLGIKLPDGSTREEKVDVFPQSTEKNLKLE